jgi:hypothetical protein
VTDGSEEPSEVAAGAGKRSPTPVGQETVPAAVGLHRDDRVHLLQRQQRAVGPTVSWLAAVPSGAPRPVVRGDVRGIRGRGTRGIGRGLAQPGFQLADARLKGPILRAQGGVLQPERRQLLQERGVLSSRHRRPPLGRQWWGPSHPEQPAAPPSLRGSRGGPGTPGPVEAASSPARAALPLPPTRRRKTTAPPGRSRSGRRQ